MSSGINSTVFVDIKRDNLKSGGIYDCMNTLYDLLERSGYTRKGSVHVTRKGFFVGLDKNLDEATYKEIARIEGIENVDVVPF